MSTIKIVAGNYHQAKLCAQKNYLNNSEFSYVDNVERLYGLNNFEIWYTGTYFMNKDTPKITEYCKTKNIPIIIKRYE